MRPFEPWADYWHLTPYRQPLLIGIIEKNGPSSYLAEESRDAELRPVFLLLAEAQLSAKTLKKLRRGISAIGGSSASRQFYLDDTCRLAIFSDIYASPDEISGATVTCN